MAILGLQGVRGGVGTTSVTAALAWSLQLLGESVLVIDACADNLLRMSFNVDFTREEGWARALLDDKDWRDAGMRYTSQLDLLPFGQLTTTERENEAAYQRLFSQFTLALQSLKEKGHYRWILLDLPHGAGTLTRQLIAQCDHVLSIVNVDANCHIRLHQQGLPQNAHILINDLRIGSQIGTICIRCGCKASVVCFLLSSIVMKEWLNALRPSNRSASTAAIRWRQKRS